MINLQLLIIFSLLNLAQARFNIGIIDAIDHQIQQLGKKVEETKLETKRYTATTDSNGVVIFTAGSGRSLKLKVMDEEIPNLAVNGAKVHLYTDYFGLDGCYLIYDPKGRYLPYISNLVDKVYLTYYRAIFTGTTNYIVNSVRMKDKNWEHLIDDLFWYIGYLKVDDLKKESPWWDRVDKQFTGFPVWKVVMILVIDLEGEYASGTTVLSERYYLGKDDFFYNFYTNLGYKPEDRLAAMSVFSGLKNEIFKTGIGLVMIIPEKELKQKDGHFTLSGIVKYKDESLSYVNVFLHPPVFMKNTDVTGLTGEFKFYNLSSGNYILTFLKPGYKRKWEEVSLISDKFFRISLSSHNNIPIIHSVTAERKIICLNEYSVLTSSASDPDGESLTYQWIPESGTIEGAGHTVKWRPPNKPGVFNITSRVYDNDLRFVEGNVSVEVVNNNAPIISTVTATPSTILIKSDSLTTTLECKAVDPDGDILSYHWSSSTGTFKGGGWKVVWEAPSSTGTYKIKVEVRDGKMGVARRTTEVRVKKE